MFLAYICNLGEGLLLAVASLLCIHVGGPDVE